MTPAEKPNAYDKNFVFVFLVKKANALPMPVERPANNVSPNANKNVLKSIDCSLSKIID